MVKSWIRSVVLALLFRTAPLLLLATKVKNFNVVPAHIYYGNLSEVWLAP